MDLVTIDIAILLVIILAGVWGLWFGVVRLVFPFTFILVITTVLYTYPQISTGFGNNPELNFFFYIMIGFVGFIIFGQVGRLTRGVLRTTGFGPMDHLFGLILGLILGSIIVGAIVWSIQTYHKE